MNEQNDRNSGGGRWDWNDVVVGIPPGIVIGVACGVMLDSVTSGIVIGIACAMSISVGIGLDRRRRG